MIYDLCLFFFLVIVILFISFRHKIHELFRFSLEIMYIGNLYADTFNYAPMTKTDKNF